MNDLSFDVAEAYYIYNMLWEVSGLTNRDRETGRSIPMQLKRMGFKARSNLCDESDLTPEGLKYYNELVHKWEIEKYYPDGTPSLVVCFDNGGETWDRYSVIFIGYYNMGGNSLYVGMSHNPFAPQGFGQHGEDKGQYSIDDKEWVEEEFNHWGKIIPFVELPEKCKELVLRDYKDIWG